jgi:hypothetical protein
LVAKNLTFANAPMTPRRMSEAPGVAPVAAPSEAPAK